jgi:hypothetical protein
MLGCFTAGPWPCQSKISHALQKISRFRLIICLCYKNAAMTAVIISNFNDNSGWVNSIMSLSEG